MTSKQIVVTESTGNIPQAPGEAGTTKWFIRAVPLPGTVLVFRNGILQVESLDFSITDNVISFAQPSENNDIFFVRYML